MALGDDIQMTTEEPRAHYGASPQSLFSQWKDLIDAAGVDDADNTGSRVTQISQIDGASRHPLVVRGGTLLEIRAAYDANETASPTSPVVQVFGNDQEDGNGTWELLEDEDGNDEITLTLTPGDDLNDGTLKHSAKAAVDLRGNRRVLVGVKTAHAAGNGDATLAKLIGKVL